MVYMRQFGWQTASLVIIALLPGITAAQETRGMIFGRVLDTQSAVIAGASVSVRNEDTSAVVNLKTNATGYYEANLLLPGNYVIAAEAAGFKKTVRSGVALPVSTQLQIDLSLEVGSVSDSISVTAEAPMLETNTVSSGRVMDNRSLMDLPAIGNQATQLVKMTPGVGTTGVNNYVEFHSTQSASRFAIPGAVGGNDYAIDGAPNLSHDRYMAYVPHSETLQEFKVETAAFDASIGQTTGASVAMMTKSGTNTLHGTASNQIWQQRWNGTPFFVRQKYYSDIAAAEVAGDKALADNLRSQPKQASGHSNNFAGTIGGPVVIPKLLNGRDRLFFFFSYNGSKSIATAPGAINYTVPTLANRNGDFSSLLNVDAGRYQIYDPLTISSDPARAEHFVRSPFPGNIVPQSRIINPAYKKLVDFLPPPNNSPSSPNAEPVNNYLALGRGDDSIYNALSSRVDYARSERNRFFFRWNWADWHNEADHWAFAYEGARAIDRTGWMRRNIAAGFDWVYMITPTTLLNATLSVSNYREGPEANVYATLKFRPTDLNLPAYMDAKADGRYHFPVFNISGYTTLVPETYPSIDITRHQAGKIEISQVRGKHTLRGGFDLRQRYRAANAGGATSGSFTFNSTYTRRNEDTFTPAGSLGHSWAAFMMGIPGSDMIATRDSYINYNPYYAAFLQDNIRLTTRLTVTLGLRMEYELGPTERFNRFLGGFDPTLSLPISAAAEAAYARAPVSEMPVSSLRVVGGTFYPAVGGAPRQFWGNELMWLPRVGAAYQLNAKTVVRGGYGLFFDTVNVSNFTPDQTGFSKDTSGMLTTDFGMTWLAGDPRAGVSPMSDPFPVRADGTRFDVPVRDALGSMARAGRGFTYNNFDMKHGRVQRWRLSVQRQLTPNMSIEAAYAGSYSDRITLSKTISFLPESYWADGLVRNSQVASNLDANVTNPFHITNFADLASSNPRVYNDMASQSFFTSATVRKSVLLRAFPQMNGLTEGNVPSGEARTHDLELSFQRRLSKGLNLILAYTRLYTKDATAYLNEFDSEPYWEERGMGRPHRLTATGIYELPFGRSRKWLQHGIASRLFGGFEVAVTYEFQPGDLLSWGNLFYYGDLADIRNGSSTLDRWFNTDSFERTAASGPASYHRRVFPTRVPGVRGDLTNQWNANVMREFRVRERFAVQFRMDALNLANRSQFAAPELSPYSTNFGKVTSVSGATKRFLQAQLRVRF